MVREIRSHEPCGAAKKKKKKWSFQGRLLKEQFTQVEARFKETVFRASDSREP